MQSRNDHRASPNPSGMATTMGNNIYQYSLGGHAYAPLPKGEAAFCAIPSDAPG